MFVDYETSEYAGEAEKHKQRAEDLERLEKRVRDVESFEIGREPRYGGDERGVVVACEAIDASRTRSVKLYRRAVAAEIAIEIGHAGKMQMNEDGLYLAQPTMWADEGEPAEQLREDIESHDYLALEEVDDEGDYIVYTMECDFDEYYRDKL